MRLKRQGLEVSAEVKNELSYICTHPYAFMVCKRENFKKIIAVSKFVYLFSGLGTAGLISDILLCALAQSVQ
jgi:hypothetical protein